MAMDKAVDNSSAKTIEDYLERLGCGRETQKGKKLLETIRRDGWRSYGKAARNKNFTHCRIALRS
jgi:hypothetical protein